MFLVRAGPGDEFIIAQWSSPESKPWRELLPHVYFSVKFQVYWSRFCDHYIFTRRYLLLACDGLWKGFSVDSALKFINNILEVSCTVKVVLELFSTLIIRLDTTAYFKMFFKSPTKVTFNRSDIRDIENCGKCEDLAVLHKWNRDDYRQIVPHMPFFHL